MTALATTKLAPARLALAPAPPAGGTPRSHRRRRRLGLLAAVLGALALVPATASAWSSDSFSSPTRNIRCHNGYGHISCMTLNTGLVVSVSLYGVAYTGGDQSQFGAGGPTLYYGQSYNVPGRFHCVSHFNGMTCTSVRSGHGFFINRTQYQIW